MMRFDAPASRRRRWLPSGTRRRRPSRPGTIAAAVLAVAAFSLTTMVGGTPAYADTVARPRAAAAAVDPLAALGDCQEVRLPVGASTRAVTGTVVAGTFCVPNGKQHRVGVDVMVHGGTYNRGYWNWSVQAERYSYVLRTLRAGRAAFFYDRLGAGASSRPASDTITVSVEADILHRVIGWLRATPNVSAVNVVGHSFGSVIAVHEAAMYADADRLAATGYLHAAGPGFTRTDLLVPADSDPKFAGQGYDKGYGTTLAGSRHILYFSSSADPAIVASDEALKDVASSTFVGDAIGEMIAPAGKNLTNRVTLPVLLVAGEQDALFCGLGLDCTDRAAVVATEVPYFTAARSLTVATVPDTGHVLALHPSADKTFSIIDSWLAG